MKKKVIKTLLMHLLFIGCLALFVIFVPCPLFKIFKIPCPLCGMTRAIVAFFQGQFLVAFALHPLFITFPFVFLFLCHARLIKNKIGIVSVVIIIAIIVLAYFITYFVRDKSILLTYPQPFFR